MVSGSKLHFQPWKGIDYSKGYYKGLKLLILGDSHHGEYDPGATKKYTSEHLTDGLGPYQFLKHIEEVVTGASLDPNQRRRFWDRVSFSNYIQEALGKAATHLRRSSGRRRARAFR